MKEPDLCKLCERPKCAGKKVEFVPGKGPSAASKEKFEERFAKEQAKKDKKTKGKGKKKGKKKKKKK